MRVHISRILFSEDENLGLTAEIEATASAPPLPGQVTDMKIELSTKLQIAKTASLAEIEELVARQLQRLLVS